MGENWRGKRELQLNIKEEGMCLLKISNVIIFYMMSCANGWHTWTWVPPIPRYPREMSVLGDCIVPSSFVLCWKAPPSCPACRAASGLGLGLSTAVLQILTRREHTICCLYLKHAIYRVATHSRSVWTLIRPPVWVASLGDVDAFLIPTGLWGVLSSDILNLNLASCLPVLPSLHIYACLHLRKKICSEKKQGSSP